MDAILSARSLANIRFNGRPKRTQANRSSDVVGLRCSGPTAELMGIDRRLVHSAFSRHGLDASIYRDGPLARRIAATLRAIRVSDPVEGVASILQTAESARKAINALLIGYTLPFRDESVFRSIYHWLAKKTYDEPGPRIWCVACSNGVELLSLALMLAELDSLKGSMLRGTDVRRDAIEEASRNEVQFWDLVPEPFLPLRDRTNRPEFEKSLKQIDWRMEDVFASRGEGLWDVVMCRNLAIYLRPEASVRLWARLANALAPGGLLVTGKAEQPYPRAGWERLDKCLYQRIGE